MLQPFSSINKNKRKQYTVLKNGRTSWEKAVGVNRCLRFVPVYKVWIVKLLTYCSTGRAKWPSSDELAFQEFEKCNRLSDLEKKKIVFPDFEKYGFRGCRTCFVTNSAHPFFFFLKIIRWLEENTCWFVKMVRALTPFLREPRTRAAQGESRPHDDKNRGTQTNLKLG